MSSFGGFGLNGGGSGGGGSQTLADTLALGNNTGETSIVSDSGDSILDVLDVHASLVWSNGVAINSGIFSDSTNTSQYYEDGTDSGENTIDATENLISHSQKVNISTPVVNLSQQTASRILALNASKDIVPLQTLLSPATGDTIIYNGTNYVNQPYEGYTLILGAPGFNPADATTYYLGGNNQPAGNTTDGAYDIVIPKAGTIKAVTISSNTGGTLGSNETSSISIRLNSTSDTLITSSFATNPSPGFFSNTSMSVSVAVGDKVSLKWVTPTYATNPTTVRMNFIIYIE